MILHMGHIAATSVPNCKTTSADVADTSTNTLAIIIIGIIGIVDNDGVEEQVPPSSFGSYIS